MEQPSCVATPSESHVFVPMSFIILLLFCIALTVHYLLVRREARLMRSMAPLTSEPDREENKTSTPATGQPPPATTNKIIPHKPPSSADATAPPEGQRNEETGEVCPSPETLASAKALAQRVRDLGLHLGDVMVTGISLGLPNGETGGAVFAADNLDALMQGKNFIGKLPAEAIQAQLDRNVVQARRALNKILS